MRPFKWAGLWLGLILALSFSGSAPVSAAEKTKPQGKAAPAKTLPASKTVQPAETIPSGKATSTACVSGWMLDQRSRVMGEETLFVSPIGIKLVNRKDGLTFVNASPFSEVFSYSLKTRKFCRQRCEKSENPYARAVAMFSGISHGQVPMKKERDYAKGGLMWTHYAIPVEYKNARIALFQKHEVTGSEPASGRLVGFHMNIEKRALDWIARLLCVPKTGTIPFDVTFVDVDNESHSLVKTYKMVPTKVSAADFKCPSGLHPVRDPRSVIQDEAANDAIEMMMSGSDRDGKPRR